MTRLAIYGAGAVGGYLAARLIQARPDLDVTMIGRQRLVEAVEEHGLILREAGDSVTVHPPVTATAAGTAPCDLVLLTVRTYDVASSIEDVRRLMGGHGLCLAFQNGVGTEETLAATLGRERVLACTLTVSAGMEEPGVITRYSRSGGVALATMDRSPVPPEIVGLFAATGLPTVTIPDYRSLRWSKLLLNMLCAPTSAILDLDIADIVSTPHLFGIEQRAFREAGAVMDAAGIETVRLPGYPVPLARLAMRLPRPLAQRTLGRRIAGARGGRSPGMRNDVRRGRAEIADFNGAIVREANRLGLAAPVNHVLTTLTEEMTEHPEKRDTLAFSPATFVDYIRRST